MSVIDRRPLEKDERVIVESVVGQRRKQGVVAEEWTGESDGAVLVRLDGKTKSKGFPRSFVRPLTRAAEARPAIPPPPSPRPSARVRRTYVGPVELKAQPKPQGPYRSDPYLDFVRAHRCVGCRRAGPNDPHHFGPRGLGQKTDDTRTVPLCRECHARFHQDRKLPALDVIATRIAILACQVDLLTEYQRTRETIEVAR